MNHPLSILYVDDEPLLLNITKEYLESLGFIVDIAESGKQALQIIEDNTFDAIVSDYQMPGMDGIQLLKEIRGRNLDIPFILFTGRGREEVVIEAIENGADFYLQKGGKPTPQFTELSHKIKVAIQRRRDSTALRESELRFKSLIQNSSDIIRILDKEGIITFDSPSSSTILGYPEGSLVGSKAFDYIHPDDQERVRSDFLDVGNQCNNHIPTEYRIRKADGSYLYVDSIALNLNGVPGINGIVTTTHPVQNLKMAEMEVRKMADDLSVAYEKLASTEEEIRENFIELTNHQQALAKSEERFRSMAERSSDLILIIDENMRISYASPSSNSITGYNPEELMGKTQEYAMIVVFSESLPEFISAVQSSLGGNPVTQTELAIRKKDGNRAFVEMNVVPVMCEGTFAGAQVSIKDITQRRNAQISLRESESKFRALVEYSLDGILILDHQGKILFANVAAGKIIDVDEQDELVRTQNILEYIAPESRNDVIRDFNEMSHGIDGHIAQYKIVTKYCEERWVESIGKSIEYQNAPSILISFRDITDRRKSQEILRFTQEKFTKAFLSSPDAIIISELESGKFVEINNAVVSIYGYSLDEMTDKSALDLGIWLKYEDRKMFIDLIKKYGRIEKYEVVERRKSGELFHASVSADVISLEGKKYLISTIRDISDRKRYEQDLFESEKNARALINAQEDSLFMMIPDGTILYINETTAAGLGYPVDEIRGNSIYHFLPPDVAQKLRIYAEQVFSSGKAVHYIDEQFGRIIEVSFYPIFNDAGEVSRVAVNGRDVTEKMEADRRIYESEEKYRLLAENVHDVIWTTDEKLHFTYISPSVTKLRGFTPEEVMEKSIRDLMTPESLNKVMRYHKHLINAVQKNEPVPKNLVLEIELCCKDGSTVWAELMITAIIDSNTHLMGLVGVTRDISQRRQVEEALRKANRQLNLLSGITRHDILNMISVLYASISFMETKSIDPVQLECLKRMELTTTEIQSKIEFTRIYEELGSHKPQWISLDAAIPCSSIPESITLTIMDLHDYAIFSDPMLGKVFFNLLDNSIRHGQRVSNIQVSLFESGDDLIIVWEDNGVGISDAEKEDIFERGVGKNTGYGLFLVREILSLTDITIRETGSSGSGARFEIIVPKGAFRRNISIFKGVNERNT